jgi:hypothetical protein
VEGADAVGEQASGKGLDLFAGHGLDRAGHDISSGSVGALDLYGVTTGVAMSRRLAHPLSRLSQVRQVTRCSGR